MSLISGCLENLTKKLTEIYLLFNIYLHYTLQRTNHKDKTELVSVTACVDVFVDNPTTSFPEQKTIQSRVFLSISRPQPAVSG